MTPADPVDTGRRSLAEGDTLTPPASPDSESHNPASCPECLRLDQQLMAAAAIDDRSRCSDIRVLRERHILKQQPWPALWSEPFN